MFNANEIKLKGQYKIVINTNGSIRETNWFDNLITNIGLDQLGTTTAPAKYARVGDGDNTPSVNDTQLENQIGASSLGISSSVVPVGYPNYESEIILKYSFTQGQVVGTISEVGIGWSQTGQTLFSRTLITDEEGNFSPLTLTSLDQLFIFYKITTFPSIIDYNGVATFGPSSSIGYTSRISTVGAFYNNSAVYLTDGNPPYLVTNTSNQFTTFCAGSTLGSITGGPSVPPLTPSPQSESFNVFSITYDTYQTGTYYRDVRFEISPFQGNVTGGIQALSIPFANGYFKVQILFNNPITKTNSMSMRMSCRVAWARV